MPAPHRRNKGEILANVGHREDGRAVSASEISNRRERHAAHEQRHAGEWEKAVERLSIPVQKHAQGSAEFAEAVALIREFVTPELHPREADRPVSSAPLVGGHYLGKCLDCATDLWVFRAKPRQPLCEGCKERRTKKRRSRR